MSFTDNFLRSIFALPLYLIISSFTEMATANVTDSAVIVSISFAWVVAGILFLLHFIMMLFDLSRDFRHTTIIETENEKRRIKRKNDFSKYNEDKAIGVE